MPCNLQLATCNSFIGLLGGSFNPAHEGHIHISREAMRRLKLGAVWWLVTPRNPLKRAGDLGDYADRLATARQIAQAERGIIVTDIEQQLNSRYTFDTLVKLKRRYPGVRFIWLMGADNLAQFHRWNRWRDIAKRVDIVVFDRAPFSHNSLRAPAALALRQQRMPPRWLAARGVETATGWAYVPMRRHVQSATRIRKTLGKSADQG
jgi:nicotinate-nucleotide adenylyltransferase